jgi:signal transduction histidine kinase
MGTPLSVVGAALRLLDRAMEVRDADGERELLETALRNLQLVELQAGRFRDLGVERDVRLQRERVDLAHLVRELVEDLSKTLLAEHQTRAEVPDELLADLDPVRVRQLLYALLSNAAKYCPSGQMVVVTAQREGDEIVLEVRDQGHSVAPEHAEQIFERYERRAEDVEGAGLGLYLGRRYAQAHGGELLLVPADDDGGNTFEARLPSPAVGGSSGG